ncbi:sulfur carrier protein ThiS [Thiolapillus sp.]
MNILLNGENITVADATTLADIVRSMNLEGSRYAIEVNEELVPRSKHDSHRLKEGDNVEIVQAIGGG